MAKRRRDTEVFSLSFLDCICCGFGAIILLLVLSKIYEPVIIEKTQDDLESLIALLQQELFDIRGETAIFNRDLQDVRKQTSDTKIQLARLQGELNTVKGQYEASQSESDSTIDEGALASAKQRLTEEMRRLQPYYKRADDDAVAGIPVDSEYIIFIIDTSGSMQQYNWGRVQQKLTETLDVYPQVKGLQIMNDNGNYMFKQYAGRWIPDTPGRRDAIVRTMRNWRPFSDSNPADGIIRRLLRLGESCGLRQQSSSRLGETRDDASQDVLPVGRDKLIFMNAIESLAANRLAFYQGQSELHNIHSADLQRLLLSSFFELAGYKKEIYFLPSTDVKELLVDHNKKF